MEENVNEITPLVKQKNATTSDAAAILELGGSSSISLEHGSEVSNHRGTIGLWGGISIMINTSVGPAILNLPATYQQSGFIPTTVTIVLVCILSNFCSLNLANVISKIPGNSNFQKEVEYSESFHLLWGDKPFIFTQVCFFICTLCLNMASIVDTAQVVDDFLASVAGHTSAIKIYPLPLSKISWNLDRCLENSVDSCEPFGDQDDFTLLLSVGYLFSAICFMPIGFLDLKENIIFQVFSLIVLVGFILQFLLFFWSEGLETENLSAWGNSWQQLFGIILFNYTATTAVPAWLYEKSPDVGVRFVLESSIIFSSVLYIVLGSIGALALPNISENMLTSMITGSYGRITQYSAALFAFIEIGFGIPLYSVIMRLNLTGSGLCSLRMGNFLAVILPWAISWMFYNSSATAALLSWGGTIFSSIVVFIAPLMLELRTAETHPEKGSIRVWGCNLSQRLEVMAIRALLALAIIFVLASIIGQVVAPVGL